MASANFTLSTLSSSRKSVAKQVVAPELLLTNASSIKNVNAYAKSLWKSLFFLKTLETLMEYFKPKRKDNLEVYMFHLLWKWLNLELKNGKCVMWVSSLARDLHSWLSRSIWRKYGLLMDYSTSLCQGIDFSY